jgi:hypothetical protein
VFGEYSIMLSAKTDLYKRTYMKAQNLLDRVGGIIQGILIIANIVFFYFRYKLYFNQIIKDLSNTKNEYLSVEINANNNSFIENKHGFSIIYNIF